MIDHAQEERAIIGGLQQVLPAILDRSRYALESIALKGTYPLTDIEVVISSRADDSARLGVRKAIWLVDDPGDIVNEPIVELVTGFLVQVGTNWRSMPLDPSEAATVSDEAGDIRWYRSL